MKKEKQQPCPNAVLMESFVSNQEINESQKAHIALHLRECPRCQIRYNELSKFYQIFCSEINLPASSSIFDFIDSIKDPKIELYGLLLTPVEPLNGHKALDYYAEIVISSKNNDKKKFSNIKLNDGEIFLRAVKSRVNGETALYMLSPQERLYRNIKLQLISEGQQFSSDGTGKLNLGKFDISNLEHQVITVHLQD